MRPIVPHNASETGHRSNRARRRRYWDSSRAPETIFAWRSSVSRFATRPAAGNGDGRVQWDAHGAHGYRVRRPHGLDASRPIRVA